MYNKNVVLINNPYHSPTKYNPKGKFCPMGIINRDKFCIMPCVYFDSIYCTYWTHSSGQEQTTKHWKRISFKNGHEITI